MDHFPKCGVSALILADGVAGSQREAGQKGIETANITVRFDQQ
jgi:hypothetical protein